MSPAPRVKPTLSLILAAVCGFSAAHAGLLVYEPFDYAIINDASFGRVAGRNGGLGFGGAWLDSTSGSAGGEAFVYDSQANPVSLYGGVWGAGLPSWNGVVSNLPTLGGYAGLSDWSNQGAGEDRLNSYRPLAQSAGAMAASNGGVLWLSAVWHFQDSSFFAPVGIALTSGGSFDERARTVTNSPAGTGNAIGVGLGNDFNNTTLTKDLNPVFFSAGSQSAKTTGTDISTTKDNIIILKFEFGATDTVRAWYFTEDQTMTETAFNTNAKSVSSTIDENTLNTLAFSTIRTGNAVDEFRIGTTFNDVITGTMAPRQALEITNFLYDRSIDKITLTWKSNPGETYGIYGSEDLSAFRPYVAPALAAHPTANTTTLGPIPNPKPGADRVFLRVGLPDLAAPTLDRIWGNNSTISLDFSEAMLPALATNPANYSVVKSGGGTVAITSAVFSPGNDTVVLTTATPLALDSAYTVTMNNLTDLAARPLPNGTVGNFRTWDNNPTGVKVFIVAGQSNMIGRGSVETGNGGINGAIGSLRYQAVNNTANYAHLLVDSANPATSAWRSRTDVQFWWNRADIGGASNITKGDLKIGYGSDTGKIGPEFGIGWALGDHYGEPVLVIKTAWGGKDLYSDFRSPLAAVKRGGKLGPYYAEMFKQVHEVLDNLGTQFPAWTGAGYQIAGFGWHQGWNDILNPVMSNAYEENLVDLIKDLRTEFGRPNLPVSIGATGQGGVGVVGDQVTVINAQLAVANPTLHPEFAGTVFSIDTRPFWRASTVSPANDTSHWNNNGETLYLIGDSMGDGMVNLLSP